MSFVEPLEADRRPVVVPLARMVEHDVEDHLDVVLVQLADHHLEFINLRAELAIIAIARLRGEKGRRVVSPGVRQTFASERVAEWAVELVVLHDRHQLDGGDPEFIQIGDLLDEPSIRPAHVAFGRVMTGEPPDVDLVDDRIFDRVIGVLVPLPIKVAQVGHAPRGAFDVGDRAGQEVTVGLGRTRIVVAQGVSGPPVIVTSHGGGIRVKQHLGQIEPGAVGGRVIWTINTIIVEGPVGQAGDEDMPDVVGPVGLG